MFIQQETIIKYGVPEIWPWNTRQVEYKPTGESAYGCPDKGIFTHL